MSQLAIPQYGPAHVLAATATRVHHFNLHIHLGRGSALSILLLVVVLVVAGIIWTLGSRTRNRVR